MGVGINCDKYLCLGEKILERFIRYLYEYEQGKRIRNVGFVKVETGNEETTLGMQAKGFRGGDDRKLVLYLFYEENGELISLRREQLTLVSPALNHCVVYTQKDADNFHKIKGVLLVTGNGRRIAATWDDRPVDVSRVKEFVPETAEFVPETAELVSETAERGLEEENSGPEAQEETEIRPLPIKKQQKITKIQRQDISRLPRCEWKLANNQFLIHGYNNYHYLVLIEDENVLKLGVPGIYHIKEEKYAEMFGFGEFLAVDEMFGYWCRPVKRRQSERRN